VEGGEKEGGSGREEGGEKEGGRRRQREEGGEKEGGRKGEGGGGRDRGRRREGGRERDGGRGRGREGERKRGKKEGRREREEVGRGGRGRPNTRFINMVIIRYMILTMMVYGPQNSSRSKLPMVCIVPVVSSMSNPPRPVVGVAGLAVLMMVYRIKSFPFGSSSTATTCHEVCRRSHYRSLYMHTNVANNFSQG